MNFSESLAARCALLKGQRPMSFSEGHRQHGLHPGARTLCKMLRSLGFRMVWLAVASNLRRPRQRVLGLHTVSRTARDGRPWRVGGKDDRASGDTRQKRVAVADDCASRGLHHRLMRVAGDGANDIPMLTTAGWESRSARSQRCRRWPRSHEPSGPRKYLVLVRSSRGLAHVIQQFNMQQRLANSVHTNPKYHQRGSRFPMHTRRRLHK